MIRQLVCSFAIVVCGAAAASAQVAAGGEFIVNSYTTGVQVFPNVASTRDGSFVAVWNGLSQDGPDWGVFGQRFDAAGGPRGSEFQVNTYTTGNQALTARPGVAVDAKGNSVVVWPSQNQDGSGWGVFGQRHSVSGVRLGAEFQVNTYTTGDQGVAYARANMRVAMAPGGAFVVVWSSVQDGDGLSIHGQRYDATGSAAGAEFLVNSYTTGAQVPPNVSMDRAGNFVVAWTTRDPLLVTRAQRYDAAGIAQGAEFQVNTETVGGQGWIAQPPGVGHADDGSFVVSWDNDNLDGSGWNVAARRFDSAGNGLGAQFRVNTYTTGIQRLSALAVDGFGNFVVTHMDAARDGNNYGVFAHRFDAAGNLRGAEFQVNTHTTDGQMYPAVSADPAGNFVVAWISTAPQDGSGVGIVARRYGGLLPQALRVDVAGNQVWEPGESVQVRPVWRSANASPQTFGGTLANLAGPGGSVYAITDATAAYGTVASGADSDCSVAGDCYSVINALAPRPSLHVDASAVETITPDSLGQMKRWVLHVGASFTDVASSNGFYRFIETLLHHGVTGGCAGTQYCPATTTTRDQMAVFVLVGKEGAGYVPPACGATTMFADVPASSPYCRFIEELARRGVVGGCGGGNYCPAQPATRAQMSVFVLRTLDPALSPPSCGTPMFADVPASSPFCPWVEELARRSVVSGCGGGNYCPNAAVTREQMAVFISVTFGLTLYGS